MKPKNQIFTEVPFLTDKTQETYKHISNADFIEAVFFDGFANAWPWIVSKGGPGKNSGWAGERWDGQELESDNNNYFSLASFKKVGANLRRKIENFNALHALVLDDVGSKVKPDLIKLKPSWIIETSKDNYQFGYIFNEPIRDLEQANKLFFDVIAKGLSDPGMNGPSTRLARLPVSVNTKYDPPQIVNLRLWNPELKYSLSEIYKGLDLEEQTIKKSSEVLDEDEIWISKPKLNPVIEALKERGLYKSELKSRKHDITCPWVHEHTQEIDSGTAYFEPSFDYPSGGFNCFHGHCIDRKIGHLLELLSIDMAQARLQAKIRCKPGELHRIVDAAEKELSNSGYYFQQNNLIKALRHDVASGEASFILANENDIARVLSELVSWEMYDDRIKRYKRIDPPSRHITNLSNRSSYNFLPVLKNLAKQPYFRLDDSIVKTSGYDAKSGIYGDFDSTRFFICESPSKKDALNALQEIKKLLKEFSFKTDVDLSAAIVAILTAVVRPTLKNAPMFHVRAHMIGSGKSYLCKLITLFATPEPNSPFSFPANDEECTKLLVAELLTNAPVIEFDNLTTDLIPHKSLCSALTAEYIKGRVLGKSKTVSVSTKALVLSSGNNVGPLRDMTRRCLTINLSPELEMPVTKKFERPNLIEEVLKEREKYVSFALTIIHAWILANKPYSEAKTVSGYSDWCSMCVQPLLWLGCKDPLINMLDGIAVDPERERLIYFVELWKSRFDNRPVMVRHLLDRAEGGPGCALPDEELKEVLHDIAGEGTIINSKRLGRWLSRHVGQIVNGFRLVKVDGARSSQAWRLEQVKSV